MSRSASFFFTPVLLIISHVGLCQTDVASQLLGAWTTSHTDSTGMEVTSLGIITDGYLVDTWYNVEERKFVGTAGGSWTYADGQIQITFEFSTFDPSEIGTTTSVGIELSDDQLVVSENGRTWTRVDDGSPGELNEAWLITGRQRDGEMREWIPGVRKTMKILSGTRFQWIAYNIETREFFGTGGGTYTAKGGKYTENIEFFSRNSDRVGAALVFDYELKDGRWHHRGKSSSGNPIYEIWSTRSSLDKE